MGSELTIGAHLAQLATEINAEHEQCGAALAAGLAHALRAGELLCEVKGRLPHGAWQAWVAEHCAFSLRTAQGYMRVFRHAGELGANTKHVAHLPLRGALAALAAPQDPDQLDQGSVDEEAAAPDWRAIEALEAEFHAFWADARITLQLCRLALVSASTVADCQAIADTAGRIQQRAAEFHLRMARNAGAVLNWMQLVTGIEDVETLIGYAELERELSNYARP